MMPVLPTLGTGILINSGQALAVGGLFSLLVSYGFILALAYCMGTAVAEVAEHMPVNGGTVVNHSYLRWYSLAMLVPFETTNSIANLGLLVPHPQLAIRVSLMLYAIVGLDMLPERMLKLQALWTILNLVTTVGLLGVSVFLGVHQAPGTAAIFIFSVTSGLSILFLSSCMLCNWDRAPTVFRRRSRSGVPSIVNGLTVGSFPLALGDLMILGFAGMVSFSLLCIGHWLNPRLHGPSSPGSGPG